MHAQSESIGELAKALALAQAEFESAKKDGDRHYATSTYNDLAACTEACQSVLPKHQLSVVQTTGHESGSVVIYTTLLHASGQWIRGSVSIGLDKDGPRALGEAIARGRRYGLCAIVGLTQDDAEEGTFEQAGERQENDDQVLRNASDSRSKRGGKPLGSFVSKNTGEVFGPETTIERGFPFAREADIGLTVEEAVTLQESVFKEIVSGRPRDEIIGEFGLGSRDFAALCALQYCRNKRREKKEPVRSGKPEARVRNVAGRARAFPPFRPSPKGMAPVRSQRAKDPKRAKRRALRRRLIASVMAHLIRHSKLDEERNEEYKRLCLEAQTAWSDPIEKQSLSALRRMGRLIGARANYQVRLGELAQPEGGAKP